MEMTALFSTDRSGEHPVATAAALHFQIVTVHPFVDGNGRTARLVMNLLLLRAGFPPLRIQPEERGAYFAALDAARFESVDGFLIWIAERMEADLEIWLRHLEPA